jgi:hypothetical protein
MKYDLGAIEPWRLVLELWTMWRLIPLQERLTLEL